ncbi:MAG: helix-turn-helix domain-containing protein [Hyphomicrobiaceae bacterium]
MNLQTRTFRTSDVPASRSLGAWRDFMSMIYYRVDVSSPRSDGLRGELKELQLGPIGLSRFMSDQQRVFRHRSSALRDNADHFVFIFPRQGRCYFDQLGRSAHFGPGSVVMLRSAESYEAACGDSFENVTIKVPAPVLEARVEAIGDRCASLEAANPVIVPIVADMAARLIEVQAGLPIQESHLSESLIELLAAMMTQNSAETPHDDSGRGMMRVWQGKLAVYIRRHMTDSDLSPEHVARAHGISVRYIHRIFQSQGTSFGRWVLEQRLKAAHAAIVADRSNAKTLQTIAFDCGFSNQSHFSTSYKELFGETPRMTRERSVT